MGKLLDAWMNGDRGVKGGNYHDQNGVSIRTESNGISFFGSGDTRTQPPPPDAQPVTSIPQVPENPGIRKEAYSTYGVSIPVSIGRRAVTGNVIDATDLVPVLVGGRTYVTETVVPKYLQDFGPL